MKVTTLNSKMFSQKCAELISKLEFHPDLVVGILNGGGHVVSEFKAEERFKCNRFEFIKLQRNDTLKKNKIIGILLKILPYKVLNCLRVLESKKVQKHISELILNDLKSCEVDFQFNFSSKEIIKNILIVDDAIDTGKTMYIVKNSLSKLLPNSQIKMAVISWTMDNSIIKPDYYLFKNVLVRFPWSKDYKGKDFGEKSFSS